MKQCETVYIAGPITLDPDYKEKFEAREKELETMGYRVFNPVKLGERFEKLNSYKDLKHNDYMNFLLPFVLKADGISLLAGWENSKGAKVEKLVAEAAGKVFVNVKLLDRSWNS